MRAAWLVGFSVLLMSGCEVGDFGDIRRYQADFEETHALKPGARLELENFNGPVEITGSDAEEIVVRGTKYAASRELLDVVRVEVNVTPDSARIRTSVPRHDQRRCGVSYILTVPRRVVLDRITTSNGGIRVDGTEGAARLKSSNGRVRVDRLKGDLQAETSNGSITVADSEGAAELRTSNGRISAERVKGRLDARSSNGSIEARLSEPLASEQIRLVSSNGSITVELDQLNNNEVYAETSNASVTLRLPPNAEARLRASTSNGSISCDFPVDTGGRAGNKNYLEGVIGKGGPLLDLRSSNGAIRVAKR